MMVCTCMYLYCKVATLQLIRCKQNEQVFSNRLRILFELLIRVDDWFTWCRRQVSHLSIY